jgi:tRNA dimethylallyltransferase
MESISKIDTIYIVGPTASGKSALSIELAKELGAEIICADSQTLRRGMDIGTAKPTPSEREGIPHHMLDCIDPYDSYNLSMFLKDSRRALRDIHARGKQAIIVGGTGLYTDALYFNFQLPDISDARFGDMSIEELRSRILELGLALPQNSLNPRHLINTIRRNGARGGRNCPDPSAMIFGINPGREVLIERINRRVDAMFDVGFIDEVRSLLDAYGVPPRDFDAIGYRIAYRYIKNEIDVDEAKALFKIADRQYAKRQMSWYRRNSDIVWFASPDTAKSFILDRI